MDAKEIKKKIDHLDYWLTKNPTDPNHAAVQKDKRDLEKQLEELQKNG